MNAGTPDLSSRHQDRSSQTQSRRAQRFDMAANILKEFWPDLRQKFPQNLKATGSL
jgi:hypothetical protein